MVAVDLKHFEHQGYAVVKQIVPEALCARLVLAIESRLGIQRDDASTWYRSRARGYPFLFGCRDQAHEFSTRRASGPRLEHHSLALDRQEPEQRPNG